MHILSKFETEFLYYNWNESHLLVKSGRFKIWIMGYLSKAGQWQFQGLHFMHIWPICIDADQMFPQFKVSKIMFKMKNVKKDNLK